VENTDQPAALRGHRDLRAYQLAYKLAMQIFDASKKFPTARIYRRALTRN
jgi:hypothetical protein